MTIGAVYCICHTHPFILCPQFCSVGEGDQGAGMHCCLPPCPTNGGCQNHTFSSPTFGGFNSTFIKIQNCLYISNLHELSFYIKLNFSIAQILIRIADINIHKDVKTSEYLISNCCVHSLSISWICQYRFIYYLTFHGCE